MAPFEQALGGSGKEILIHLLQLRGFGAGQNHKFKKLSTTLIWFLVD